ncbi:MAG: ABC transporter permease [Bacteroidales bacterium]|nr:ABC transporter permease [Bacteroidales bacterium]
MLKTSFIQFFKIIRQNKFFTFLNLFGISITMMIILVAAIGIESMIKPGGPEENNEDILILHRLTMKNANSTNIGAFTLAQIDTYFKDVECCKNVSFSSITTWNYISEYGVEDYRCRLADAAIFDVFDFQFIEGRPFNGDEEKKAEMVTVIDTRLRDRFFPDESAIGKQIEISGKIYKVLGVVEKIPQNCIYTNGNAFIPYTTNVPSNQELNALVQATGPYHLVYQIGNESTAQQVKDEVESIRHRFESAFQDSTQIFIGGPDTPMEAFLRGYSNPDTYPGHSRMILKYFIYLILLMLLPAITTISIQLTRIQERSEEIGVRKSFGASRGALIRQILFENILLSILGSFMGLLLAIIFLFGFKEQFSQYMAETRSFNVNIQIDYFVFVVATFATLVFSLLSGFIPALRMSGLQIVDVLKGGKI